MAKKSFSGGLSSLLGKAEKLKNSGTKVTKKKITKTSQIGTKRKKQEQRL
jgi:hypothetical protein